MKEFAYIHDEDNVPATLKDVPFLESFSKSQLDDVLHSSAFIEAEPGDAIIHQGEEASRIFILLAGEIGVVKDGDDLATMSKTGDIFGELAALDDDRRSASIVAKTKVFCLAVDQKFIEHVRPKEENPSFYAALYEFIARLTARRLRLTSEHLAKVDKELQDLKAATQGKVEAAA